MKFKRDNLMNVFILLVTGVICCIISILINAFVNEEHVHRYDDWVIIQSPTCTDDGIRERYCSCGDRQEGVVAALGHDYGEWEQVKAATCISLGEKVRVCSRDSLHFEMQIIEMTAHTMSDWIVDREATCMESGEKHRQCSGCHLVEDEPIEAYGHDFSDWVVTLEATCTEIGEKYRQCSVCLIKEEEETEALGHTFGAWITVTEPSCTATGQKKRICARDDCHIETEDIEKLEHSPSEWIVDREPTCELAGARHTECLICHGEVEKDTIGLLGHNFGEWQTVSDATCTQKGREERTCSRDKTHIDSREIDMIAHTSSDWITVQDAECEKEGLKQIICEVCKTLLESESIAALEHQFEYFHDDKEHFGKCSVCKKEDDRQPHDWDDNFCATCDYDAGGTKNLFWTLGSDDNYYTLSGLGQARHEAEIIVPETYNGKPVTKIGESAFRLFQGIGVTIPSSVTSIPQNLFFGCENLQKLVLPFIGGDIESPSHLGYLFGYENFEDAIGISSLNTIEILSGAKQLADNTFMNCTSIRKIVLPSTIESLGENCFYGCSALEEIVLSENLKCIGEGAFWACISLKSLVIPASVEEIGRFAFFDLADGITIKFDNTTGWTVYQYPGGQRVRDISPDALLDDNAKNTIGSNQQYIWKRKD